MARFESFLPLSKSIAARQLILAAGRGEDVFSELVSEIENTYSLAQDTVDLIDVLKKFFEKKSKFLIGEGGSSLRFFSLFLSRQPGKYQLQLGETLGKRSHVDLFSLLDQLGCQVEQHDDSITLNCSGWPKEDFNLSSNLAQSSQHISGLVLAALGHSHKIKLELGSQENWVSEHYLDLTLQCCGISPVEFKANPILEKEIYGSLAGDTHGLLESMEIDLSSAFSLASLEFLRNKTFQAPASWKNSIQPDRKFVELFQDLESLLAESDASKVFECDLRNSPDLAPVLSVLVASLGIQAELHSLHHLKHKESPRDKKISELLDLMQVPHKWKDGCLSLGANTPNALKAARLDSNALKAARLDIAPAQKQQTFNSAKDHRMVMAAALAQAAGHGLDIEEKDCVSKSFPLFWQAWHQLKEDLQC